MNTGWTPDVSPKPATLPQLRALLNKLQGMEECASRNNAIAAIDNAIDLLIYYRGWLEFSENETEAQADSADLLATEQSALGTLW